MEKSILSSERFIELFISLKQKQHLNDCEGPNLFNLDWSFDVRLLSEFIQHSKKDYRFCDLLNCFSFNGEYSISLIFELNRALQKHLLTGIYDDKAYISKYYTNYLVLANNQEFINIMESFMDCFDYFCLDRDLYLKNAENFMNEDLQGVGDNSRIVFDLQRRIVKTYEKENI